MGTHETFHEIVWIKWIGNISKKNIILHGGEVLRAVVVFVYSSVGRVLFKKAILVVVLESILQQRDQETPRAVLLFQAEAWRLSLL